MSNNDPDRTDDIELTDIADQIETAGAKSEDATGRDGFLSYHAESHAAGMGVSLGMLSSTTGNMRWASGAAAIALYNADADTGKSFDLEAHIRDDIKSEPNYLLGGLAVGLFLGNMLSLLTKGEAYGITIADVIRDAVQLLTVIA